MDIFKAIIDKEDLNKIKEKQWHVWFSPNTQSWYVRATNYLGLINGKPKYDSTMLHRFILNVNKRVVVDHYDHDTLNNRKQNLRISEYAENDKHRSGENKNNTSGYRNVCWKKQSQKWIVQLQINKKNKILGSFDNVDEAGKFAKKMREKYYGEYKGN